MANVIEKQLEKQLGRVRRRVRLLTGAYGAGHVLVVASAGAAGVVTLDYLLNLPAVPRLVVLGAAAAGVAFTLFTTLARPLVTRLSLSDLAGRVERAFPEFEDRLRSSVAFGAGELDSAILRTRVIEQAEAIAGKVRMTRAIPGKPAAKAFGSGAGALAAVALLALAMPGEYRTAAWGRVAHPFSGIIWPKRTAIEIAGRLPARVAAGERVPVQVRLTKGDRPSAHATVFYQYDNGPIRSELMSREADGVYGVSLDAKVDADTQAALKVWVTAGDDEKHLDAVAIVPRLAVRQVIAHVEPPEYAKPHAVEATWDLSQGGATLVEGSKVNLELVFNKPLAGTPQLTRVGNGDAVAAGAKVDGVKASLTLATEKTLRFTINGRDTDGFPSSSLTEYEIAVRADAPPAIQIELPRRNEDRTPNAVVPVQALAEDDFAVQDVTLHVRRIGDGRVWEIPLVAAFAPAKDVGWAEASSTPDRVRMRLTWLWELSKLQDASLRAGDVLEYDLAARDNYRKGELVHEASRSSRLRITIVSQEDMAARFARELQGMGDVVEQVKARQHATRVETADLSETHKGKPLDDAVKTQLHRLGEQESTVAAQTKGLSVKLSDLMARMAENRLESRELPATAKDVHDTLDRAAEDPMKTATADLNQASQEPSPVRRDSKLGDAAVQEKNAEAALESAQQRLASLGSLRATLASISKILEAQRQVTAETKEAGRNNVGKTPEQMSAQDRAKADELKNRQSNLGKQTEKLLESMDQQAADMAKSDPQTAEALKESADAGKQQGVPGAQGKASEEIEKNQQQDAANDQKRAEIGLATMMESLRAAERHKMEELSRKLADLQEQLSILIRRQAGHNLDNVGLRSALQKMDAESLARLLAEAERTSDKPSQGDAVGLSSAQEQTERNARGQSEMAAKIEGAGEVAEDLTRAASRMERAAVLIRVADLAGAYEPPQVEALAALEHGKKVAEELKKKVDDAKQQQAQETIRALYVAIRADQDALLKETTRLDAVKARVGTAAGADMPRAEQLALNSLAPKEAALAERTARVEEPLLQLGSTVYVWANKDIVSAMSDVREALGQRATGKPTQAGETRILDQLDAMVASLATKPIEPEFEQKSSGGGGQCKQKMPSEAELRLLKALQLALNKGTKTEAVAPAPDRDALGNFARRQGQLRQQLGDLMEKSSQGGFKLGPEPDRKALLPEETDAGLDDGSSLDQELLGGKPHGEESDAKAGNVVDRMARVRQRLAEAHDPGDVTQKLQTHVIRDLDALIDAARQQQAKGSAQPNKKPGPPSSNGGPKTGIQANNQGKPGSAPPKTGGSSGVKTEATSAGGHGEGQTGGTLLEGRATWGAPTPRLRSAIVEGSDDKPLEKYRTLIDDYYRALAEQSPK